MASPFNERKATEAAAHLLALRGGQMHYLKLLKLLYIADREALAVGVFQSATTITFRWIMVRF